MWPKKRRGPPGGEKQKGSFPDPEGTISDSSPQAAGDSIPAVPGCLVWAPSWRQTQVPPGGRADPAGHDYPVTRSGLGPLQVLPFTTSLFPHHGPISQMRRPRHREIKHLAKATPQRWWWGSGSRLGLTTELARLRALWDPSPPQTAAPHQTVEDWALWRPGLDSRAAPLSGCSGGLPRALGVSPPTRPGARAVPLGPRRGRKDAGRDGEAWAQRPPSAAETEDERSPNEAQNRLQGVGRRDVLKK